MALPNNALQQVQTYQESQLAYLSNYGCFVSTANTKFKDFEKLEANLGSSVTFDKPPRYVTTNTLVADLQPSTQLVETLTVNQAMTVSYAFSTQQFVFNVHDYMDKFGKSAVEEFASVVEANVALNAISGVVNADPTSPSFGQKNTTSGPFRFFGNGTTAINSFGQLAQINANFRNFGAPKGMLKVYLPDTIVPQIVNTGLQQFATTRNNELANSWEIGNFNKAEYYASNLLPIQYAGTLGNDATTLTLVSTNDPTGANVTQLVFSGAGTDSDAIKSGDMAQFQDGVSGKPNIRFLTWIGHKISRQPVQFRATADASSSGGNVTVDIYPPLCWQSGNANQNLSHALEAGMQVEFLPDHAAGLVIAGDALFMAMPALPDQPPYPTSNKYDEEIGISIRLTYGTLFGQNQQGFINDGIWGSQLVPEYSMRIAFPLSQ
jgi:hypothetical protein